MALDHIIKQSCRFNIKNPQHRKVNDVLVNLDPEICKSKSQFLINAAEYYIDHFGKEAFTEARRDDSPYVTKKELKDIEERTVEAAVTEARNEVIRLLGGVIAGCSNLSALPQRAVTEEVKQEEVAILKAIAWLILNALQLVLNVAKVFLLLLGLVGRLFLAFVRAGTP